ncbi:hypothetical protein HAX54_019652, partial [Datura stramonium]|nr:hypothetical protein [Datura stramonium]
MVRSAFLEGVPLLPGAPVVCCFSGLARCCAGGGVDCEERREERRAAPVCMWSLGDEGILLFSYGMRSPRKWEESVGNGGHKGGGYPFV